MTVARAFLPDLIAPPLLGVAMIPLQTSDLTPEKLGVMLLRDGTIQPHDMVQALALLASRGGRLTDILVARGMVAETTLYQSLATNWGVGLANLSHPADARLIDAFGASDCLRHSILPWRKAGGATVIVTAYPEDFEPHRPRLTALFGTLVLAVAPARQIESAVLAVRGPALASLAETRVPESESCRHFRAETLRAPIFLMALTVLVAALLAPAAMLIGMTVLATFCMLAFSMLKLTAWMSLLRPPPPVLPPPHPPPDTALPTVSVMVALYKEGNIAPRLVKRLGLLDYPQELLEVLLVVEAEDHQTRSALAGADLPPWMRVVAVPAGRVKTKPRALNFALDHCHGSIVGVYDAEDAPAPDQIRRIVDRFLSATPDLACVQAMLDYYNPHTNWLARCFTIEYAAWFRQFLPGLERLGMVVPLGGTSLFFRRDHLERLGRWDAHNVTEDADLGIRLARHGLRTEVIASVTMEEANCRALPWVKQRSRWSKGFMMTWLTHMRDPRLLWRQLGPRRFVGVQVLVLGSILQSLLAPLLWSFWLVPLGVPHPMVTALSPPAFTALYLTFFATTALTIAFDIAALRRTGHRLSPLWVPTLIFYHPLASFAAYKALWELLTRPFYWDKTSHGLFD